MSRSLLARTLPEFYAEYADEARKMGASEADVAQAVATAIREAKVLADGKCPQCGAPIARYVDYKLQQGPSDMPGVWVMYRCSTAPPPGTPRGAACDFMADLKEGEAAN